MSEVELAAERLQAHDAACAVGEWQKSPFHLVPYMLPDDATQILFAHSTAVLARAYLPLKADLARLTRENAELRARCEWRPIDTAPKDGTWVWIYMPGTAYAITRDYPIFAMVQWRSIGSGEAKWYGDKADEYKPTHWMPLLPEPPQPKPSADGKE